MYKPSKCVRTLHRLIPCDSQKKQKSKFSQNKSPKMKKNKLVKSIKGAVISSHCSVFLSLLCKRKNNSLLGMTRISGFESGLKNVYCGQEFTR